MLIAYLITKAFARWNDQQYFTREGSNTVWEYMVYGDWLNDALQTPLAIVDYTKITTTLNL